VVLYSGGPPGVDELEFPEGDDIRGVGVVPHRLQIFLLEGNEGVVVGGPGAVLHHFEGIDRIERVPPGTYTVSVWSEGTKHASREVVVPAHGGPVEVDFLLAGQAALEAVAGEIPGGTNIATMTMAGAEYSVDGDTIEIAAIRMPGVNVGTVVQMEILAQLAAGEDLGEELRRATVGGKQVYVAESDDETAYLYAVGDVLFMLGDMDEAQAATILAALP
jgi:hypothetical protein